MPNFIDLTGEMFGVVEVLERAENSPRKETRWLCRCHNCGKEFVTLARTLRSGGVYSCGCMRQQRATAAAVKVCTKHGGTHHCGNEKLYNLWLTMKARCYSPKKLGYKYYGGRGIAVCDEWKYDYSAFRSWSYANGYREGLSIDRIDVDGNYCPENCRWVPKEVQHYNKRNTLYAVVDGEKKAIHEWSRIKGISYSTICNRIYNLGWTLEEAITTPVKRK